MKQLLHPSALFLLALATVNAQRNLGSLAMPDVSEAPAGCRERKSPECRTGRRRSHGAFLIRISRIGRESSRT
jgi:hypothetical protein